MQYFTVTIPKKAVTIGSRIGLADTFLTRLVGLLGKSSLEDGSGLLIRPSSGVHTMWMRFAIDVAFLDRAGTVLSLAHAVAPGRLLWGPWRGLFLPWTVQVLELPAGTLAAGGARTGERLRIESRDAAP